VEWPCRTQRHERRASKRQGGVLLMSIPRPLLEREIDRLHAVVDAGTKQPMVLHPDTRAFWAEADFPRRRDLVWLMIQRAEIIPRRSALRRFERVSGANSGFHVAITDTSRSAPVSVSLGRLTPARGLVTPEHRRPRRHRNLVAGVTRVDTTGRQFSRPGRRGGHHGRRSDGSWRERPVTVAVVSATVVVLSIATGMVLGGDIPEALWFLLVPIGMFGGGVVTVIALVMFLARRTPSSRRD
jgi:hypothetical protein